MKSQGTLEFVCFRKYGDPVIKSLEEAWFIPLPGGFEGYLSHFSLSNNKYHSESHL